MKPTTEDIITSTVRTIVPLIVAALVSITGVTEVAGFDLSALDESVSLVLTGGLYYVTARILEMNVSSSFGWLLGKANAPKYDKANAPE